MSESGSVGSAARQTLPIPLGVVLAVLLGLFALELLPARTGKELDPVVASSSALITIVFFALLWQHRQRKLWVGASVGVAAALLLFGFCTLVRLTADFDSFVAGLYIGAANSNLKGPKQLDDATRLDRSVAGPGHRITYQMTLTKIASTEVSKELVERLGNFLHRKACGGAELKPMFDQNVTVAYEYSANDGPLIGRFEFSKQSCASE